MAEFTWKFSEREKWIGRHPILWFSVGRDSHRSAKERLSRNYYTIIWGILQEIVILLGGVSDCEGLVGVIHRRWCDWPCV